MFTFGHRGKLTVNMKKTMKFQQFSRAEKRYIRMIYVHVEVEKSSKNVIREKVYMINKNLQMKNYLIAPKRNCY